MVTHAVSTRPEERQDAQPPPTGGAEEPRVLAAAGRTGAPLREERDRSPYRAVLSCAFDSGKG